MVIISWKIKIPLLLTQCEHDDNICKFNWAEDKNVILSFVNGK